MSVVIRLAKVGKRGTRLFRVVAIDKRKKRNGVPAETLGTYAPDQKLLTVDQKRIVYWKSKGALVTTQLQKLLSL